MNFNEMVQMFSDELLQEIDELKKCVIKVKKLSSNIDPSIQNVFIPKLSFKQKYPNIGKIVENSTCYSLK